MYAGYVLGIWICGCSLLYKRVLWASKSGDEYGTKSTRCTHANAFPGWYVSGEFNLSMRELSLFDFQIFPWTDWYSFGVRIWGFL